MKSASDVLPASGILTISSALLSSSVSTTRGRKEAEAAAALFARRGASPMDSCFDALSLSVKTLLLDNVPAMLWLLHLDSQNVHQFRFIFKTAFPIPVGARRFFLPVRRPKPSLAAGSRQ
jgi:hypothetical protein